MRFWNKFVDEHVMNYVSMHGWHRMVGIIARSIEAGEFEKLVARIPLYEQREKWKTARSGFSNADLANATRKIEVALDKVEQQLSQTAYLAGDQFTLADINFFAMCGVGLQRMFPEMKVGPRLVDWLGRVQARPGVQAALSMPDHTNPALRTFDWRKLPAAISRQGPQPATRPAKSVVFARARSRRAEPSPLIPGTRTRTSSTPCPGS